MQKYEDMAAEEAGIQNLIEDSKEAWVYIKVDIGGYRKGDWSFEPGIW